MEPDENTQPEDLLWGLCCHEAGHVVVGHLCGYWVGCAFIRRSGRGAGTWSPPRRRWLLPLATADRRAVENDAAVLLAGAAAACLATGDEYWRGIAQQDRERIFEVAMRAKLEHWELAQMHERARHRATELLQANWPAVEAIARALMERRRLWRSQILRILRAHGIQ